MPRCGREFPRSFSSSPIWSDFARERVLSMDVDGVALTEGIVETVAASGFKNYIRPIAYFAAGDWA